MFYQGVFGMFLSKYQRHSIIDFLLLYLQLHNGSKIRWHFHSFFVWGCEPWKWWVTIVFKQIWWYTILWSYIHIKQTHHTMCTSTIQTLWECNNHLPYIAIPHTNLWSIFLLSTIDWITTITPNFMIKIVF